MTRSVEPVKSSGQSRDVRVLALLPYPRGRVGGQRYRFEQWSSRLESRGIAIAYSAFLSPAALDVLYQPGQVGRKSWSVMAGYAKRWRLLQSLRGFDVVYVYREAALLGSAWLERRIAHRCPIVFDFDDAIYLPATSPANASFAFLKHPGKAAGICRAARIVTVGNDVLAAFARRHAACVEVIPTTIDTSLYRVLPRGPNPKPIVGWTGSLTTVPYLSALAPALRRLRTVCDFELRVIGAPFQMDGVDVRAMPWRAETEVEDLRPMDVGLMPLPDDDWARGKCALKALQYMALGIPPVVSPVGAGGTVVQDGVNGMHVRSEGEWVDRIAMLIGDPALRARLGAAARRTVEAQYSADVQAPRMADVLRRAAGRAPVA